MSLELSGFDGTRGLWQKPCSSSDSAAHVADVVCPFIPRYSHVYSTYPAYCARSPGKAVRLVSHLYNGVISDVCFSSPLFHPYSKPSSRTTLSRRKSRGRFKG